MPARLRCLPEFLKRWLDSDGYKIGVVMLTIRCFQGRYLLRPSERANSLILGILGRAQEKYAFELYGYQFSSNHYDLMLGARNPVHLAKILNYINSNLSCELGRPEHSDWSGRMFEARASVVAAVSDEDILSRFRYLLAHGVKEGLVARCEDWPGVHCARALRSGRSDRGIWVDRTKLCCIRRLASDRAKKPTRRASLGDVSTPYVVSLSKLPFLRSMSDDEYRKKIRGMCREIADEAAAEREKTGRSVMGAKAVMAMDPHHRPEDLDRSPAPPVYCRDKATRAFFMEQYALFVEAYRGAKSALNDLIGKVGEPPQFPAEGIPPNWASMPA